MKALIVGAGAVGQTFGHHLARGGAEVSVYVRERYAEAAREGFSLQRLGLGRRPRAERFDHVGVVTTVAEAQAESWDQVWLCVSSTALASGALDDLLQGLTGGTLIALQPGLQDRDHLLALWPEERLVQGVIMFIAYQSPLPGEEGAEPPGVAFWLPPLSPCPFAGARPDVDAVVGALKAGGLPATHDQKGPARAMLLSAILMPNLVALEAEGWSLSRFIAGEHRKRAKQAAEEALAIVAQETGVTAGAGMRWAGLDMLGLGLRVGRGIMPLPLEPYLAYHFTKVGDQTRAMIDAYIAHGAARGLKTEALEALTGLLG